MATTTMADDGALPVTIPEGFTLHTENTTRVLLPANNGAFLNPVQEFNRDMSVACIRVWSEQMNAARETRWRERLERAAQGGTRGRGKQRQRLKRPKGGPESGAGEVAAVIEGDAGLAHVTSAPMNVDSVECEAGAAPPVLAAADSAYRTEEPEAAADGGHPTPDTVAKPREYQPHRFVLLEALSATGLRAIRYAKEIPLVKYVIANDLSTSAVEAIKRNVELNGLGPQEGASKVDEEHAPDERQKVPSASSKRLGKVHINEGDACALMYSHRAERQRVDCVDLDPYGTAAPFIDAAVQCVNDGGLLCVTCTDLAVLATNNYPEKCFSNYGGVPLKAEYCHEAALRLVLHTISTSAARYGRYIHPLLSLSIDFYVRLFVRIQTAPIEVKKAASKTSMYYVCSGCQSFYDQPLGKIVEKVSERTSQVNLLFRQRHGPPVSDKCPECNSTLHVAGPMWSGSIHDGEFAGKVLEHLEVHADKYGTATRMKGMATVAKEELDTPFYFTPSRIAGFFHCISPSLEDVASALLHAGHAISRSHALAGSLKTTATRQDVHDVYRGWVKLHPVKPASVPPGSASAHLHAKEPRFDADFTHHPQSVTPSSKVKLVRYQQNPTPNWGPGTKASSKRKRVDDDDG